MRFIFALEPHAIAKSLEGALHIALQYFDRIYKSDCSDHDKILLAEYDYRDTHDYPRYAGKNASVFLIKGSPNRGIAIARDMQRYYEVSVDSIEAYLRVYVLKDQEKISEFREMAHMKFLASKTPISFKTFDDEFKVNDHYLRLSVAPIYSHIEISPAVEIRSIEQRRPLSFGHDKEKLSLTIPTFAVPFALYDILEDTDKNFLAMLVRKIYG